MSTLDTIAPILQATYGKSPMVDALAEHLARHIEVFRSRDERDTREAMVARICWDWMTGGSTAAVVAKKIEAALAEVPA